VEMVLGRKSLHERWNHCWKLQVSPS
jgi:hypothetical protein